MTHKHLDLLFKKALRYEHHQENFQEIILNDVTPFELRIKKTPETEIVNRDFHIKWYSKLKNLRNNL